MRIAPHGKHGKRFDHTENTEMHGKSFSYTGVHGVHGDSKMMRLSSSWRGVLFLRRS